MKGEGYLLQRLGLVCPRSVRKADLAEAQSGRKVAVTAFGSAVGTEQFALQSGALEVALPAAAAPSARLHGENGQRQSRIPPENRSRETG